MESEQKTPTLDEMFQGLPKGTSQQSTRPKYTDYAERFKGMAATHRPRMIVPAILIAAVVILFGTVGWYMVRTLDSVPAAPMSAAQAFQGVPQAEEYRPPIATLTFTPTPYVQPQATPQPPAAPRQVINVVRVGNAAGIVYEWGQTATGGLVINHEGVNYCAPGGMRTDALWAIANTIYNSPELRTHYVCR